MRLLPFALKEGNKGKIKVQNGNSSVSEEQSVGDEGAVVLTGMLNTELAVKVFAKAIEAGYMSEKGSHYKWNDSKVLLAYMCGRIYCGDILIWTRSHSGNSADWESFPIQN